MPQQTITLRRKLLSLATAMVCLIAASCGGGSSSSADTPQIDPPSPDMVVSGPVRGSVITDATVAGARVQLYTHDGQLLPGEAYTDDNGEFEITVAEARYGLRVVARGGATDSGSFDGTLSAYVEPFDAELPVRGCNKFCVLSHDTDPRRGTWQDAPNRRLMMS